MTSDPTRMLEQWRAVVWTSALARSKRKQKKLFIQVQLHTDTLGGINFLWSRIEWKHPWRGKVLKYEQICNSRKVGFNVNIKCLKMSRNMIRICSRMSFLHGICFPRGIWRKTGYESPLTWTTRIGCLYICYFNYELFK